MRGSLFQSELPFIKIKTRKLRQKEAKKTPALTVIGVLQSPMNSLLESLHRPRGTKIRGQKHRVP